MIACEKCHRLRRPEGLHICLPCVRGRTVAATAPAGHVPAAELEPRRISAIRLPGDGAAARVWNALVEGRRTP